MLYNNELFLNDKDFLRLLDLEREKEIFVKIISLDFSENPLEEIEGRVTQGSVNVDGTSAMRRTCSLTLVANELNIHDFYWSLNTKFKLYVGLKNSVKQHPAYQEIYKNYPDICWFKMGTYVISSFSTSQSTNSYTINISGKDKLVFLNGELGGVITPLSWDFGQIDEISADGFITRKKYLIKNIILEAVHEHAQEPYWNIIINDLDDYGLELLEYRGEIPMYLLYNENTDSVEQMSLEISVDGLTPINLEDNDLSNIVFNHRIEQLKDTDSNVTIFYRLDQNNQTINGEDGIPLKYTIVKVEYGDVIGYRTTELVYAGDLISNVGESVTNMLDKIVSMLGNFEYFYDLNGRFVFQRKKTYIQSTFSPITQNDKDTNEIYVKNAAETSACTYSFDNAVLVTSFQNSPNLEDVKNDFSLWGTRKGINGVELPVHLRYAIDSKPWMYTAYNGITYITKEGFEKYNLLMEEYKRYSTQVTNPDRADGKIVFQKIQVPDFLRETDGSSKWWDLQNWADYYYLLTGKYPEEIIGNYGTEGYVGELIFPNGYKQNFLGRGQLVIDLERDSHNLFYGNEFKSPTATRKSGYKYITKGSWEERESTGSWSPTQHGFGGCYHTYKEFLYLDANNNCQSFIYSPQIPTVDLTDDVIAVIDNVIIEDLGLGNKTTFECDWRELIYQMSLDYNKYHHDEDFLIKVDANNTLPDYTHLYPGGYTGYEQYYIDINGFWRTLYDPTYTCSFRVSAPNKNKFNAEKSEYYMYQNCEGLTFQTVYDLIQETANDCGYSIYTYNYKQQPTVAKVDLTLPFNKLTEFQEKFDQHPEKYYYIKNCKNETFNSNTIYYTKITGEYDENNHWSIDVTENPEGLNFWFDFLDTEGRLSQYKVCKIGDRTKASNDNNIKAIYFRDVPTVVFIDKKTSIAEERKKQGSGYTYIKLPEYFENLFSISAQGKSAMDVLNEWLYSYAYCAESISMNALPIYYLEPNTRIFVRDDNSGINGEYIVTKLTFPLNHSGLMSISATKAVENLY